SSMVGRILPLAEEVGAAGHTVDVLTLSGSEQSPYTTEAHYGEHVTLRTVGPSLRATQAAQAGFFTTVKRFFAGRTALFNALTQYSADIIVLAKPQLQNTSPVLAIAQERGIPLLLDVDDDEVRSSRIPIVLRGYVAGLEARAIRAAAAVTAASPALVEHVREHRPDVRTELFPTGIRIPSVIRQARLRERLHLSPDAKILLYVGSLSISSGHRVDLLLEAFSELVQSSPDVHLVLAGDGIDAEKLRTMAHTLFPGSHANGNVRVGGYPIPERIHFLGRFTPPEDIALAREANLLVDPVDHNPANIAKSSHRVLLALATGTPIIAGNIGIRPILLPPALHRMCLYDPHTRGSLHDAIVRSLNDGTMRLHFQQQTVGRVDQWTWPMLRGKFVQILESVATKPTRLSPST
ncbi:MAG: hypothetical protein G01um1014106_600, partial [Parcubacteria group bacterium Gr01-1014_106]